jgi:NOL1/NOP2/fmu family ribosome biogenesis protein
MQPVFAQKAKKDTVGREETKIKISGVLEAGFDINNKVNKNETEYKKIEYGQIEFSASPVKKVRAEFGFEYKNRDSTLVIDKLYGQYNFADFGRVRVGYMKKSFGLEERAGVDERYFHKRSIINDGIEYFGLLGHDLTFQYRHSIDKTWKITGGFSWAEDTLRYHQNYSIEYETENTNLILAAIIGHYTHPEEDLTAFATSFSFKHSSKLCVSEAELSFGNNPAVKYFEGRDIFILGARVQEYFPIKIKTKILQQVIPVAEAAIYFEELESKDFETQLRAGLTLGFAKNSAFQWRNTYGTVLRIEGGEKELRRRRFDSEVVVIF